MLKNETLSLIGKLMDLGITEILIAEDESPVHTQKDQKPEPEYKIKACETVFHNKLQEILKVVQEFPQVRVEASTDGLVLYEIEKEDPALV